MRSLGIDMSKPFLFIDTEFNGSPLNGFSGQLISMAILDKFNEFYEVIRLSNDIPIDPWVEENVIPVLNKTPISFKEFQGKLESFLNKCFFPDGFIIVADWPDDIKYFCDSLITDPGYMISVPSFETRVILDINSSNSNIPHNALEDAKAIRDSWLTKILG
jgi:hypothetical protein